MKIRYTSRRGQHCTFKCSASKKFEVIELLLLLGSKKIIIEEV